MAEKIAITCDSALDVDEELAKRYNIKVLPITIKMGDEVLLDIEDVKPEDILKYHEETGGLASTMPISVQEYFRFFTRYVHMGYVVIHFSMSSAMSKTYENAVAAAENFSRIHVIDTKMASIGSAMQVITAAEMLQNGKSSEEIIKAAKENVSKARVPFQIDEMEFLYKGGRCSALSAFAANLFKIRPSLYVNQEGVIVPNKNYRGKMDAVTLKFLNDNIGNGKNIDKKHLMLGHTGSSPAFLQACKTEIESLADFQEIHVVRAGCTITSHLGPNCIILGYLMKN